MSAFQGLSIMAQQLSLPLCPIIQVRVDHTVTNQDVSLFTDKAPTDFLQYFWLALNYCFLLLWELDMCLEMWCCTGVKAWIYFQTDGYTDCCGHHERLVILFVLLVLDLESAWRAHPTHVQMYCIACCSVGCVCTEPTHTLSNDQIYVTWTLTDSSPKSIILASVSMNSCVSYWLSVISICIVVIYINSEQVDEDSRACALVGEVYDFCVFINTVSGI